MISDFNEDFEKIEDLLSKKSALAKKIDKLIEINSAINEINRKETFKRLEQKKLDEERYVKKELEKMRYKYAYQMSLWEYDNGISKQYNKTD